MIKLDQEYHIVSTWVLKRNRQIDFFFAHPARFYNRHIDEATKDFCNNFNTCDRKFIDIERADGIIVVSDSAHKFQLSVPFSKWNQLWVSWKDLQEDFG